MVDLHTHSLLSDGVLLPSELVRRALVKGYKAIAITDHVDFSNIDFVIPRIVKACRALNRHWKIKSIPGCEITHVPPESIRGLVRFARRAGAKIVVGHGETISEPVLPGTNRAFLESGVDILAHPGKIRAEDVKLAKTEGVFLEITTRKSHSKTNRFLIKTALRHKAPLILNTDAHEPGDLIDARKRRAFLAASGVQNKIITTIIRHSYILARRS